MLALPFIGPILTWLAGPFLSFAKGIGASIGQIAVAAFKNPYALGGMVAAAFFLLWQHDASRYDKLKVAGAANDAKWAAAFGQETDTAHKLLRALNGQNAAVHDLWRAGQSKLKASAGIAASAAPAHAKAAAQSSAILAAPKGATDCAAAQATFEAARKALQ